MMYQSNPYITKEHLAYATTNGRNIFLRACEAWPDGDGVNKATLSTLLGMGARIDARYLEGHYPPPGIHTGATCLHVAIAYARNPSKLIDREALEFLVQQGADIRAVDDKGFSVSYYAYRKNAQFDKISTDDEFTFGGYRGDLWDAALAVFGINPYEFRKQYPRRPRYSEHYTRQDFENLWKGRENQCPYWDDARYPLSGRESDYWDSDDSLSDSTSCSEDSDIATLLSESWESESTNSENGGAALSQDMEED